uniref:Uncharacterized protein n=1 Tax=Caenorhabditis tropicalis TaxID=1561998 RepID=A0A1I7T1W3_9PELO
MTNSAIGLPPTRINRRRSTKALHDFFSRPFTQRISNFCDITVFDALRSKSSLKENTDLKLFLFVYKAQTVVL